jgi:TRAP-type C4-dicarboxylate transport system permease small subunit
VAEVNSESAPPQEKQRYGVLFYVGAAGLMIAMTVEAIAVLGRQLGIPLLGALEIIQAAILIAASASMLSATLVRAHATVHLLTDRLSPRGKLWMTRFNSLLSAAFFAVLACSAAWLSVEAWNEFEHSELLRIPYRPLRIIVVVMTASVAATFAYQAVRRVAQGRTA